ncbi:MAG: hypothetical protein GY729_05925, partial [Desulfobacteraceae bacterium]|nr:hypothetical protein [Desulfobacteraceae bacterium]
STTYDASDHLFGYTLGLGLAFDFNSNVTFKIGYEQTRYEDTTINATLGTRSDTTIVEPEVETFFLSLQYHFR